MHPLEGGHLVELPGVGGHPGLGQVFVEVEVAEGAEAEVDRDDHDIAAAGEWAAVVERLVAGAMGEATAVDPEHDGPPGVVEGGCEDVEVEAVFVLVAAGSEAGHRMRWLRRRGANTVGRADAIPGLNGLQRLPAACSSEGDAHEGEVAFALLPLEFAAGGGDDCHGDAPCEIRGGDCARHRWKGG